MPRLPRPAARPEAPPPFLIERVVDLGDGRRVATLVVGAVRIGSVFVIEGAVSWPTTKRGYAIAAVVDDDLRLEIESSLLDAAMGAP